MFLCARSIIVGSTAVIIAALLTLGSPVMAQAVKAQQALAPVSGTVFAVDSKWLVIRTTELNYVTLSIVSNTQVFSTRIGTFGDVAKGKYVSCQADRGADGSLVVRELRVLPDLFAGQSDEVLDLTDLLIATGSLESAVSTAEATNLALLARGVSTPMKLPRNARILVTEMSSLASVSEGDRMTVTGFVDESGKPWAQTIDTVR